MYVLGAFQFYVVQNQLFSEQSSVCCTDLTQSIACYALLHSVQPICHSRILAPLWSILHLINGGLGRFEVTLMLQSKHTMHQNTAFFVDFECCLFHFTHRIQVHLLSSPTWKWLPEAHINILNPLPKFCVFLHITRWCFVEQLILQQLSGWCGKTHCTQNNLLYFTVVVVSFCIQ